MSISIIIPTYAIINEGNYNRFAIGRNRVDCRSIVTPIRLINIFSSILYVSIFKFVPVFVNRIIEPPWLDFYILFCCPKRTIKFRLYLGTSIPQIKKINGYMHIKVQIFYFPE